MEEGQSGGQLGGRSRHLAINVSKICHRRQIPVQALTQEGLR